MRALDSLFGDVDVKRKTTRSVQDVADKMNGLATQEQMGVQGKTIKSPNKAYCYLCS